MDTRPSNIHTFFNGTYRDGHLTVTCDELDIIRSNTAHLHMRYVFDDTTIRPICGEVIIYNFSYLHEGEIVDFFKIYADVRIEEVTSFIEANAIIMQVQAILPKGERGKDGSTKH